MAALGTPATITSLLTTLADNSTGDISEGDLRNALESIRPSLGQLSQQANATATTVSASSTFYEATLSGTALSGLELYMDSPASGRLRYTGTPARTFVITATITIAAAAGTPTALVGIGVNGTVDATSETSIVTSTGILSVSVGLVVTLTTNDYVSVMVSNETDTANFTVSYLSLQAVGYTD